MQKSPAEGWSSRRRLAPFDPGCDPFAKAELSARGIERAEGQRFTVTKSKTCRWTLNADAIRAAMGEAWATAHSKVAAVVSLRITVKRAALAEAA